MSDNDAVNPGFVIELTPEQGARLKHALFHGVPDSTPPPRSDEEMMTDRRTHYFDSASGGDICSRCGLKRDALIHDVGERLPPCHTSQGYLEVAPSIQPTAPTGEPVIPVSLSEKLGEILEHESAACQALTTCHWDDAASRYKGPDIDAALQHLQHIKNRVLVLQAAKLIAEARRYLSVLDPDDQPMMAVDVLVQRLTDALCSALGAKEPCTDENFGLCPGRSRTINSRGG